MGGRVVFDQQFDPLVYENFSNFATKSAKMRIRIYTHPYIDYLFVNICQF